MYVAIVLLKHSFSQTKSGWYVGNTSWISSHGEQGTISFQDGEMYIQNHLYIQWIILFYQISELSEPLGLELKYSDFQQMRFLFPSHQTRQASIHCF